MNSLNYFHPPLEDDNILRDPKRKEELVKIMIQTLQEFGFREAAQELIEESNIKPESDSLSTFRDKIIEGQWNDACDLLNNIGLEKENHERALFLLHEQQYIEMILKNQYNEGLILLRTELTHRCKEPERLHRLASILMCSNAQEISQKLNRNIDITQSRKALLKEIQSECKPGNMMASNRMSKLLQQAISYQIVKCKYHQSVPPNFSLLEDHECQLEKYPSKCLKVVREHVDEVWIVKFSHDGNLLASLAKNNELRVWQFDSNAANIKLKYKKDKVHEKEVNSLSWSYDNKRIATVSSDKKIKIWDADSGVLSLAIVGHVDNICSVVWMPDNLHFITGGIDSHVIIWDLRGEQLNSKVAKISSPRVLELLVSSDGKMLYAVCAASPKVIVTDLVRKTEVHQYSIIWFDYNHFVRIKEKNLICTAALSKDNKFLLVNTSFTFPELHLWSLDTYELIQVYSGHFQEKFRIGCCFGGLNEQFIACGGEDANVKIFHRNCSEPVATLPGHSLTVNSVTWHPKNPKILVSAGDDHSIRVWVSEDLLEILKENALIEENQSMDVLSDDNALEELQANLFEEDDNHSQG